MYTNKQIQELAQAYLEHGDFTVSGYARIEHAGVKWLAETGDLEQEDIDFWMARAEDEFDCLSEWAHNLGLTHLDANEVYVLCTLDLGASEQRARFCNEFSNEERADFVALWMETGDPDSLDASVPEAAGYACANIDAARAGQQFGVPRATLTLACRDGSIKGAVKVGNRWEFPLASFLEWLREKER